VLRPIVTTEIAKAIDALESARQMPPKTRRVEALRQAGILRHAADLDGVTLPSEGARANPALCDIRRPISLANPTTPSLIFLEIHRDA
jgi:hypothetical protein